MSLLGIVLVVALVLLLFGGFRGSGNFRNVAWFLVVVVAAYLVVQLVR